MQCLRAGLAASCRLLSHPSSRPRPPALRQATSAAAQRLNWAHRARSRASKRPAAPLVVAAASAGGNGSGGGGGGGGTGASFGDPSKAPRHLRKLSAEQVAAVCAALGAVCVRAGPGSGKVSRLCAPSRDRCLMMAHPAPYLRLEPCRTVHRRHGCWCAASWSSCSLPPMTRGPGRSWPSPSPKRSALPPASMTPACPPSYLVGLPHYWGSPCPAVLRTAAAHPAAHAQLPVCPPSPFTASVQAAGEMRERLEAELGEIADSLNVLTIHRQTRILWPVDVRTRPPARGCPCADLAPRLCPRPPPQLLLLAAERQHRGAAGRGPQQGLLFVRPGGCQRCAAARALAALACAPACALAALQPKTMCCLLRRTCASS